MNAADKSSLDLYARRIALADALVRADDLDDSALAEAEAHLAALSRRIRDRIAVPIERHTAPRQYGLLRGELAVPPEFWEPLPEEELKAWEGE